MLKLVRMMFAWSGLVLASTWALPASAHIDMVGALKSRGGDQKMSPCDGAKGDGPTYTFQPGTTIKIQLAESIPHPSYFRIAFDDDGDNGFVEPKSIKPIEATRACPLNADDQCGEADYCNVVSATGATVLWDNLNPHRSADAKDMTWNVKLPDIECENCTIQVIQVMEDTVHGAYCPQGSCANAARSLEDIYHRCIDIKLKRDATNSPGATTEPVNNMGMNCSATPSGAAGSGGVGAAGSTAGSAGMAAAGTGGSAAGASATAGAGGMSGTAGASAGAAASGSAGVPSGAAGGGVAGTAARPGGAAGSAAISGTAGSNVGMTTQANTQNGAAGSASVTPPQGPTDSGGCSISRAGGGSTSLAAFAWLTLGAAIARMRRRRRDAQRATR